MHTGEQGRVVLSPAGADTGIQFITSAGRIPARAEFVVNTRRCTCIANGPAQVRTVEHVLSSLYGLGVDNAIIEVNGPEIPILDGSSAPFTTEISRVGIRELDRPARFLSLVEPVAMMFGEAWLMATPADGFTLTCVTQFDHPLLGAETLRFEHDPETYAAEIAPARTFGFASEVEALLRKGLAQGGNLDNALIVHEDRYSCELRLPQECARHKLLDLIGDLALAGGPLMARIFAHKPGHRANTEFAALLARSCLSESIL